MSAVELLLLLAVACGLWASVTAVLIARALDREGLRTPFPFLGLFIFRNLRRYSESTRAKTAKTGPLFYSYVVPINAALILVVIALVLFLVVGSSSAQAAPPPGAAPQSWVEEGWPPWEQELTARQQPERVMDVIGLKPGMVVGEIGAQTGRFTVHLARRVGPAGRVFANDIDDRALAELRDRVTRYNVPNIEVVRGQVDDPRLPPNALDLAIMVRTYHELAQPRAILENLKSSLKSGAPVVIVDLDTEKTRHSDAKSSTAEASVLGVAQSTGYELVALHRFLLEDTIFVLRVAERSVIIAGSSIFPVVRSRRHLSAVRPRTSYGQARTPSRGDVWRSTS